MNSAERNVYLFYIVTTRLPKLEPDKSRGIHLVYIIWILSNVWQWFTFIFLFNIIITEGILCPQLCVCICIFIYISQIFFYLIYHWRNNGKYQIFCLILCYNPYWVFSSLLPRQNVIFLVIALSVISAFAFVFTFKLL